MSTRAKQYAEFFEQLNAELKQEEYANFFDADSSFEDPFQKVHGLDAVYKVFKHMYKTLHEPRFVVEEIVENEHIAYLRWRFYYKRSKKTVEESFEGVSRVDFKRDLKVLSHIDYWDAAHNVYEKVPLLGSVLRLIRRKLHA